MDSVRKKVEFLNEVIEEMNLGNVKTSFERAEDLIIDSRSKYDIGLCRGVGNLRIILEYMIPFLKVNGRFLPQKLNDNDRESENALKILNSKISKIYKFNLPLLQDERLVIEVVKTKETSTKYPKNGDSSKKTTIGEKMKLLSLEANKIILNSKQPRKEFDNEKLEELAKSIKEYGIIQPIIVRKIVSLGKYEIVAGERRFRASQIVKLSKVPVIEIESSNIKSFELAVLNVQKERI